jgi:hypothetical protein
MTKVSLNEQFTILSNDRTESFDDDCFPCTKSKCKFQHIRNWFNLFVSCYNNRGNFLS